MMVFCLFKQHKRPHCLGLTAFAFAFIHLKSPTPCSPCLQHTLLFMKKATVIYSTDGNKCILMVHEIFLAKKWVFKTVI